MRSAENSGGEVSLSGPQVSYCQDSCWFSLHRDSVTSGQVEDIAFLARLEQDGPGTLEANMEKIKETGTSSALVDCAATVAEGECVVFEI